MIWFSVRQETANVFGPQQVNRDPGLNIPEMHPWPWDGHYKSILLPTDEEIIGSS
jgi:hypothetical protein